MAGGPPETAAEYSPEDAGLSATTNPTLHSLFLFPFALSETFFEERFEGD